MMRMWSRWSRVGLCALALAACDDSGDGAPGDEATGGADGGGADAGVMGGADRGLPDLGAADLGAPDLGAGDLGIPAACAAPAGPVSLTTADGVGLQADWYPAQSQGAPAVALFHMIPPSNDRGNYPRAFIDALTARGITVINVDRRGAGGSEGVAREAYEGPNGRLDVQAALEWLVTEAPCPSDPARLGLVGASNGTTSVLDYVAGAGARPVAGAVFLTGGAYTENQIALAEAGLSALPLLFVFSTAERAWSAGFQAEAPAPWRFEELDPGAHGTRMFDTRPESMETVADFLAEQFSDEGQ